VHGIKVLMAKNYIDSLSEEARKGMQEKAEQGIWPTGAPLGYLNVLGPDGKKTIAPDPKIAPIITHLFGWYATGTLSLREAAERARSAGLVAAPASQCRPAPCRRSCATASTPATRNGRAATTVANISP
jgi:site-specific DNA recombinase